MYVFAPRSGWNLFEEQGNTGQSTGGGAEGGVAWALSTGLAVPDGDVTFLRARQDRELLEKIGINTSHMSDANVIKTAVNAGISYSVQQVGPGTELNGVSMALIGISMGMVSPFMAIADAVENPTALAPLNIAFSTLAGAGAIIGAPASILTGDAFDSYTVASSSSAYMPGVRTTTARGDDDAIYLGASSLTNNRHSVGDAVQVVFDSLGVITAPGINAALSAGAGTTDFYGHSQGAASISNGLRLIPAGERSDIHMTTMGGQVASNAALSGYASATNHVATGDPVTWNPYNLLVRLLPDKNTNKVTVKNHTPGMNIENHFAQNGYLDSAK